MSSLSSRRFEKVLLLALGGFLLALLLPLLVPLVQAAFAAMTVTAKLIANLVGMGLIALLVTILLMPLETLGWWAGWYGDPIQATAENLGSFQGQMTSDMTVSHYVVYLDGIGQSTFDYLPDVEQFLDELAQVLPDDIQIIRGLMPYSPMNRPLTSQERPFAWFWNWVNRLKSSQRGSMLAFLVNLRNVFVVWVSADQRYGPIYNRGTAQVIYNSLINHGYQPGSGVPITLIGFSGGGQISMGAVPYLKEALPAPIDLISIAGVFSGNNNILKLEHIYHLVGDQDKIERLGPIFFPNRWKLLALSYWNRSKRLGKVSLINLGPVGHEVPGGVMDPERVLPDGRTALQQTIQWVADILQGTAPLKELQPTPMLSNLERYRQAPFNRSECYPVRAALPVERYRPIAPWMGRLLLPQPDQRQPQTVPFEIHHAPEKYAHLIGTVVSLGWSEDANVQAYVQQVTKDVHFSPQATYKSQQGGVYPTRLNHWRRVNPLESLAGAHPDDDVIVALPDPVRVEPSASAPLSSHYPLTLRIAHEPIQITGLYYGLVKFRGPVDGAGIDPERSLADDPEQFYVVHFNKASGQFDGIQEKVWLPQVVADDNGTYPFTNAGIEQSPLNETGWYIYGAMGSDALGEADQFVVRAIAPRALFQLQPDQEIVGRKAVKTYLKQTAWSQLAEQKGQISSVPLTYRSKAQGDHASSWEKGTRALLVHVYGGIGGNQTEPAAQGPVYFGHFSFGVATVVQEPLTDELRFDIVYHQIYTHNPDGLTAGTMHWSRYMGDRQFGWIGLRPVADTLINFAPFTRDYPVTAGQEASPLDVLIRQLEVMAARYRIGDGSGGTYVGPANNCAQDSNQSLYAALQSMARSVGANPDRSQADINAWMRQHPDVARDLQQLEQLGKDLRHHLMPWGSARADWATEAASLGSTLEDDPLKTLGRGLVSWRTVLPRVASNSITECFLRAGATAWMLRTNQLGGDNPEIEPLPPLAF
ncbi:CAAX amino protease [Leptolyngbya sp. KIOST-1]|uniref:CAAX amino protease n=1 Tax=Leptolyngbya sp. KIOST-1 TaxID=1229172 RepID=UPI0005640CBA|nr:CAAX amino protease [Leptolyngbya sp. KIOST-1]